MRVLLTLAVASLMAMGIGCGDPLPPNGGYYTEKIEPLFTGAGCAVQTAGCHLATDGAAAGNLDLTSYDSLMRRSDILPAYGPYPVGLLLLKASDSQTIAVQTLDPPDPANPDQLFVNIETDIRHNGGQGIREGTLGHGRLREWIDSGFQRSGLAPTGGAENSGDCVADIGEDSAFDPATAPADTASYERFVNEVQPELQQSCAGASCHGASLADFHVTCGDTEEQRRWNYHISVQHLASTVDDAELLRKPLASNRGGSFHGGGDTYPSAESEGYLALSGWAEDLVNRVPDSISGNEDDPGYRFFINRVQPVLVRKGCMALNCHSPVSLKFQLRGGSQGSFSSFARHRNYALARKLLALESPDPTDSRLVAKNLFPPEMNGAGIAHRGASLFEDFSGDGVLNPATPDDCIGIDADTGDLNEVPAYCVVRRWHEIERENAIARGDVFPDSELVRAIVWVARPLGVGGATEFDTYRPGADLRSADVTVGADFTLTVGAPRSLLDGCGLDIATADVRGPALSWDAERIAFAARTSATEPLRLYWMNEDGSACEAIPGIAPDLENENGILTHDFDPTWSPDGRLVFASTRGNLDREAYDYQGPTRTPAAMAPNSNLYVQDADGSLRQLTFLLNQELGPAFMGDGRVVFSAEKREDGFYQIALRRENLDGGDFHPLYANRPSLGFSAATELVQLLNLNFAFVASEIGLPDGAGMLAVGNRSIGPDHQDRTLDNPGFVRGMTIPAPGMFGGLTGVFRSPASLPTGRMMASCDPGATAMDPAGFDWDLCEVDYRTGSVRRIFGEVGVAEVEALAVYARSPRPVLVSDGRGVDRPDLVPGARDTVVLFNDFPMIASLMFDNTRTGRPIDHEIGGFDVLEIMPPPVGAVTFDDIADMLISDEHGPLFVSNRNLGNVPILADGSAHMRIPGGTPIRYRLTDADGTALLFPPDSHFSGLKIQREQEQYYPGERIVRSVPRRFFNAICGGCHGSISGRELDVAVSLDIVSGASINLARDTSPVDLYRAPRDRGPATD